MRNWKNDFLPVWLYRSYKMGAEHLGHNTTVQPGRAQWHYPKMKSAKWSLHCILVVTLCFQLHKKKRREQQHNVFYLFYVISGLQKNITVAKWQRKWQLKIFDSWFLNRDSWIDSTTTSFKLSTLSLHTLRGVKEKSCTWSLKKYEFIM